MKRMGLIMSLVILSGCNKDDALTTRTKDNNCTATYQEMIGLDGRYWFSFTSNFVYCDGPIGVSRARCVWR